MKSVVISLDQGTSSSRAIAFDNNGKIVALAQAPFTQFFQYPGWVEHDAVEILDTIKQVLAEVLDKVKAYEIKAIGITNQRETTVVWDAESGNPIYKAIVWQSRQTQEICQQLKADGYEKLVREKTGLVIDSYFSGPKVRWMLDNVAGAQSKADAGQLRMGTIDTWLIWHLSQESKNHKTDYSNASRTMLYNIHDLQWDDTLCTALNIPKSMLPEVCPSSHLFGHLKQSLSPNNTAIPICGVAGDQQAALFGQCCFDAGESKNTYGTGCFMLLNTGTEPKPSQNGLLTTIAWGIDNKVFYALEGAIFVAGSAVQWLRDGLQMIENSSETETLAESVQDTEGVYLVPAFTGLGAPYWDSNARGSILGITRGTTKAHIARATLESIAWQTKDVLELMKKEGNTPLKTLRVDGGAVANNWLMQFQSDVLNVPVVRPAMLESTALGAAFLAGLHVGVWNSLQHLKKSMATERVFKPKMKAADRNKQYSMWKKAVKSTRTFK